MSTEFCCYRHERRDRGIWRRTANTTRPKPLIVALFCPAHRRFVGLPAHARPAAASAEVRRQCPRRGGIRASLRGRIEPFVREEECPLLAQSARKVFGRLRSPTGRWRFCIASRSSECASDAGRLRERSGACSRRVSRRCDADPSPPLLAARTPRCCRAPARRHSRRCREDRPRDHGLDRRRESSPPGRAGGFVSAACR